MSAPDREPVRHRASEAPTPPDPLRALRAEFRSLLLVYLALAVLPLLTGFACQG
ncbi:MAG: hypothetical protein H6832_13260 [Planctomycetes bacterium]|nr:hypothetical protein [Planctomycetota bacterium]MCB9919365.1 hypothetical protein [Planctomycetota bacterium]